MPAMLRYHGHSCFELRLGSGYTIVFDPHDGVSIGLPAPSVKADLVLITHDHFDHNAARIVSREDTRIVMELDGYIEVDEVRIHGIRLPHDRENGRRRGWVTAYIVEAGDLRVAHLGDVGVVPEGDAAEKLRNMDVLMLPVGGVYTIEPSEAWETIERLDPWITVPMHYWTPGLILPLYRLDDFMVYVKKRRVIRAGNEYIIEKPFKEKTVLVMQPPRRGRENT